MNSLTFAAQKLATLCIFCVQQISIRKEISILFNFFSIRTVRIAINEQPIALPVRLIVQDNAEMVGRSEIKGRGGNESTTIGEEYQRRVTPRNTF